MSWIDNLINEGKAALESADTKIMKQFIKEAINIMKSEDVPGPKSGLNLYDPAQTFNALTEEEIKNDVNMTIEKLERQKEMMLDPTSKANKQLSENRILNINNNINTQAYSSSSSSVQIDISIAMSQTINALDSCNLSPEEIKDIKEAIADLSAEEKSNPEKVCEKVIKVLDLAKKGADAVKAVAPLIASIFSSL